jgi:hypothetical protein
MKCTKAFLLIAQIGAALVALACGLRIISGLFAMLIPVLDAVFAWMYDHAIVGGLMLAIAFIVLWFASECDRQREKEHIR